MGSGQTPGTVGRERSTSSENSKQYFFLKKYIYIFLKFVFGFRIQGIILFLEKIKSSHFAPL